MQEKNFEKHLQIIKDTDVNIYSITDETPDKTVYEMFYRACLTNIKINAENYDIWCKKINEDIIKKLDLWGFSFRRIKRILKNSTIEIDFFEIENIIKNNNEREIELNEIINNINRAKIITKYEKSLLDTYNCRPKYTDEILKFIDFDLDIAISKNLFSQGIKKDQIIEMLCNESFLLEDKLYKKELAESVVEQIDSSQIININYDRQSAVPNSNIYNNCNIFLMFKKDDKENLQSFFKQIQNTPNNLTVQMLEADEKTSPLTTMPIEGVIEASETEPSDHVKKEAYKPKDFPKSDITDENNQDINPIILRQASMQNSKEIVIKKPIEIEPVFTEEKVFEKNIEKEEIKDTPAVIEIQEDKKTIEELPKIVNLENDPQIEAVKQIDEYNKRLMMIKNHEPIANMAKASQIHLYKDLAVNFYKKANNHWHDCFDEQIIQEMLDQNISKLRILNVVAEYSPLFVDLSPTQAKEQTENLINKVLLKEQEAFILEPAVIEQEDYQEVFKKEKDVPIESQKENYALRTIKFYTATKPYDDLETEEKYLFLANKLLGDKNTWTEEYDEKIAYQLLNDKEKKTIIFSTIAKNTPAIVDSKMDYVDYILSKVNLDEIETSPAPREDLVERVKLDPAKAKSINLGIERIIAMDIPDVDFDDLQPRLKYAYLAKNRLQYAKNTWTEDDDIEICKILLDATTEILALSIIETYSPLTTGLQYEEQRDYAEKILAKSNPNPKD